MNKKFLVILSCLVLVWLAVSLEAEETPASLKRQWRPLILFFLISWLEPWPLLNSEAG